MTQATLTHKGWLGFCPIYTSAPDDADGLVVPRHWMLWPLLSASLAVFGVCFWLVALAGAEAPGWPLRITGRLARPVVVHVEWPEVER